MVTAHKKRSNRNPPGRNGSREHPVYVWILGFSFLCCRHVRGTPEKGGIGWRKDQINSHVIVYA